MLKRSPTSDATIKASITGSPKSQVRGTAQVSSMAGEVNSPRESNELEHKTPPATH